jgi:hypothetical protein
MAHRELEIGEMLHTPHPALSGANPVPLSAQLSLHVTTPGLPFIGVCKTFLYCQRPFYRLFCIPPSTIDIKCFVFRKWYLFCIFNLYTTNRHCARIGYRLQARTWFWGVSALVECSLILQHFQLLVHLVAALLQEVHRNHISFCGDENTEFFANVEGILEKYSLTHGIEYIMMWKNILSHVHRWIIIMDEKRWMNKIKEMKNWNEWKTKMKEQNKMDEHNLFATKSYVPM